jgi:hypothetical protein
MLNRPGMSRVTRNASSGPLSLQQISLTGRPGSVLIKADVEPGHGSCQHVLTSLSPPCTRSKWA